MPARPDSDVGATVLTDLIVAVFRLNGRLVAAGDRLVSGLGLTSARWQVLGALALRQTDLTVADAARAMGLTRQSVQRIANAMIDEGLLERTANPRHVRAPLLSLSPRGRAAYAAAAKLQAPWARALARDIPAAQIATATALIKTITARLESTG